MIAYSKYKDSGIPWLGQIPEHWEMIKAKYVFSPSKIVVGEKSNEYDLLSLTQKGVIKRDMENPTGKFPTSFDNYQEVHKGNFVFCLFDNEETPRTVGLSQYDGMITGAYEVFECKRNDIVPQFILYYYLTIDDSKHMKPLYKGLRKTIPYDSFMGYRIPVPPLSEQERIVAFIDDKTGKIDAYIAEREKELQTLAELKQSEIAAAVTHGLNPNVPMKDSRSPIIGKIPTHWEERKVKYCFNERSEKNHPDEPILCSTQSQGVIPQSMYANRVVVVNKGFEGLKLVKVGDFVISLRSFEGGIEYAYYQGIISAAYTILTPIEVKNAKFFRLLFKSHPFIQILQTCVTGIREGQNINYQMLGKQFIPFPPLAEQRAIVEYIDSKCSEINSLISNIEAEIAYLKEYKQRLIADAVTGAINVQ